MRVCTMISRNRSIRPITGRSFATVPCALRISPTARRIRSSWEKRLRLSAIWGGCREPALPSATRGYRSIGAAGTVGGPAEAVRHIPSIRAVILRVSWAMATFPPTMPHCSTICSVPRGRSLYTYDYDQFGGSMAPPTASAFQRPTSALLSVGGFGSEHPGGAQFARADGGSAS